MITIKKLITGGQSGVDRATLAFARFNEIAYGGWTPRSGWVGSDTAESTVKSYPDLQLLPEDDPRDRAQRNVHEADATLIILPENVESATVRGIISYCEEFAVPYMVTDGSNIDSVIRWLDSFEENHPNLVLNVAGPRIAEYLHGEDLATKVLESILSAD